MWEKITRPDQARQIRGEIPIHHRYTLGVAGERFFKELRDNRRLLASRCPKCREAFLPPKIYCELCFEETTEWTPVEGPGYVKTFTLVHLSLDEEPLEEPETVAMIGWEGIRGGLLHRVARVEVDDALMGMAVEPVWEEERTGSLADIRHFQPAVRA